MALNIDEDKKYAILGKHLIGYINMCNEYNKLKQKLREYFNTLKNRNKIEDEIYEFIKKPGDKE